MALVEAYAKEQGLWHDPAAEPVFTETLELDLSTVEPSIAGPSRPQDRVPLREAKARFAVALVDSLPEGAAGSGARGGTPVSIGDGYDAAEAASFPASDPPAAIADGPGDGPRRPSRRPVAADAGDEVAGRPRAAVAVRLDATSGLDEATEVELDHGHVAIAAITSCTNTSNPQVMVAAGLLAREGGRAGAAPASRGSRPRWRPARRSSSTTSSGPGLLPDLAKLGFDVVGLRLHHLHRQLGPAAPADRRRRPRSTAWRWCRCCRATATSRAASTPTCA